MAKLKNNQHYIQTEKIEMKKSVNIAQPKF
jgi:hypothetical protein